MYDKTAFFFYKKPLNLLFYPSQHITMNMTIKFQILMRDLKMHYKKNYITVSLFRKVGYNMTS